MGECEPMRRSGNERGSAFILAPVAVVIIVFLSAIAIDASAMFLTRRTLSDVAAAAANDAAGAGLDADAFTHDGELRLDPSRARVAALASIEAQRGQLPDDIEIDVRVENADGAPSVIVRITGRAPHIFLPGAETISASASATAVASPAPV